MEQMLAGQKAVKAYQAANTDYRACLDPLVTAAEVAAAGDSPGPDLTNTLAQLNDDYNASVSSEEEVANEFNAALREYKKANPADRQLVLVAVRAFPLRTVTPDERQKTVPRL